jgi:hypothetical protein
LDKNDDEVVVNADSESESGNPISVLKVDTTEPNDLTSNEEEDLFDELEDDAGKS